MGILCMYFEMFFGVCLCTSKCLGVAGGGDLVKESGNEHGRNRIFFLVSCLCGQSKSPYSGVFVCEGGFNVPTLLDETSFLFVQTIHYAVAAGRATPLAGVFITELKRALADSRRLMTGSGPERLRKP